MRIVHVATLLSQGGEYGGPLTVARELCGALARRGHDVTLYAGWDGVYAPPPADYRFALHRAFRAVPGTGLAGLAAPGMVPRVLTSKADVVHVHLGRDLVTLPAAWAMARRVPTVVQPHGMVMPDARAIARCTDAVATRRVLRRVSAALYLTDRERDGLLSVAGGDVRLRHLRNGIASDCGSTVRTASSQSPTVLFCARLHPRKRVRSFLEMADLVHEVRPDVRFVVAGPDEGDLEHVLTFIRRPGHQHIKYVGALSPDDVRKNLEQSDVFVLPSVLEPFPMTVLEALSVGTPTVMTSDCGIAAELAEWDAACVTDGTAERLSAAVLSLISDSEKWSALSVASRQAAVRHYSVDAVVGELERTYFEAVKGRN